MFTELKMQERHITLHKIPVHIKIKSNEAANKVEQLELD